MLNEYDVENKLIELLVSVYSRCDWRKISRRSVATDVFSHKLKVSGNMQTVERMIEKLAYSLGIQSISVSSDIIKGLKEHEDEVLRKVREETVYLTLLTMEINRKNKGGKKHGNDKN